MGKYTNQDGAKLVRAFSDEPGTRNPVPEGCKNHKAFTVPHSEGLESRFQINAARSSSSGVT